MSYRDLRNFCEILRTLRYPRLLSIENFRTPNFKLVSELLEWIVKKFEPTATLSAQNIETEQDRVMFIKQAVMLMLQNSRFKLNPKKLYMADGHAVQELLPPLQILYEAAKGQELGDSQIQWNTIKAKLATKMQEVRVTRQLSTMLPDTASALNDLLTKQIYYAKQRDRAAARAIPLVEAEKTIQETITAINQETEDLQTRLNNVANDEAELDEKIERKKREYEQMQKRLAKLQSFRPQYMDEYEKFEKRLKEQYEVYVLKFRNLKYLSKMYEDLAKADRDRQKENEKAMRLAVEKMRLEQEKNNNMDYDDEEPEAPLIERSRKVYGNMTGADMSDDEDDDVSDLIEEAGAVSEKSDDDMPNGHPVDEDRVELSSGDDF